MSAAHCHSDHSFCGYHTAALSIQHHLEVLPDQVKDETPADNKYCQLLSLAKTHTRVL